MSIYTISLLWKKYKSMNTIQHSCTQVSLLSTRVLLVCSELVKMSSATTNSVCFKVKG